MALSVIDFEVMVSVEAASDLRPNCAVLLRIQHIEVPILDSGINLFEETIAVVVAPESGPLDASSPRFLIGLSSRMNEQLAQYWVRSLK